VRSPESASGVNADPMGKAIQGQSLDQSINVHTLVNQV